MALSTRSFRPRTPRPVRFTDLSPELIQHVAFFCAEPFLGPPNNIIALQLTCRTVYLAIAFHSAPYLYDRIFRMKFDTEAPRRRLGDEVMRSSVLARELRKRCETLKRIRLCEIAGPHIREDLWAAYLMILESDQKNARQLIYWANARVFVMRYIQICLYERAQEHSGWPLETEPNALAVWLLWLTSDEESIRQESAHDTQTILTLLQPFIVAPFKYQPFFIPDTHFALPITGSPTSNPPRCVQTLHGPYPVYRPAVPAHHPSLTHFGVLITLCAPPLTPAALLCAHARRQLGFVQSPHQLLARRADLPPGVLDVTYEDYDEYNNKTLTKCAPVINKCELVSYSFHEEEGCSNDGQTSCKPCSSIPSSQPPSSCPTASQMNDHEWLRMTHCFNPWLDAKIKIRIYTPGMLDGLWKGRLFAYEPMQFMQLVTSQTLLPDLSERFPRPYQAALFMRLREHHCLSDELPIGLGSEEYDYEADGLSNAWFPPNIEFVEQDRKLHIFDTCANEHLRYETYVPGRPNSHVASGGCSNCRPDRPLTPTERRECEQVFADEGIERQDVWDDCVVDDCITDIVLSGETDFDHGRAWGFYKFIGRIRDRDGLIVLLRIPQSPNTLGAGTFVFRGYIHSSQNFVGRWRAASEPTNTFSAVEGSFSLCKAS